LIENLGLLEVRIINERVSTFALVDLTIILFLLQLMHNLFIIFFLGRYMLRHHFQSNVSKASNRLETWLVEEADKGVLQIQRQVHLVLHVRVDVVASWLVDRVFFILRERISKEGLEQDEELELEEDLQVSDVDVLVLVSIHHGVNLDIQLQILLLVLGKQLLKPQVLLLIHLPVNWLPVLEVLQDLGLGLFEKFSFVDNHWGATRTNNGLKIIFFIFIVDEVHVRVEGGL